MIIFIHYRAQMNAALNVKITTLPVNSWEEIHAKKMPVWTSLGGTNERYFSMSPKDSAMRKVYEDIIKKQGPDDNLNSKESRIKGKEALLKGNAVIFYSDKSYMSMPEYPCEFTDIKLLQYPNYLALPFHKDSPIKELIEETLLDLHIHGTVKRIWEKYHEEIDETCGDSMVSTTYQY